MTWEYVVSTPLYGSSAEARFNELGRTGWEMVAQLHDGSMVFKREKAS